VKRRTLLQAASLVALSGSLPSIVRAADPAPATPLMYTIELVIFRVINPTGSPEQWSAEEATTASNVKAEAEENNSTIAADESANAQASVAPLTSEQFKLVAVEESLKRSREYQPLAHIAWTQPGFALNHSPFVNLNDLLPAGSSLTGRAVFARGRYLHLALNLVYRPRSESTRYVINENRLIRRSSEKHYFDHPYFGVVALVTPRSSS
jgi:hypothetical protein